MLTPLATGAAARPFRTHHNALDIDLYARIAPELYLKRLLVGGFEKVYELNRNFRNEGISTKHNPEFTMLEFYWAYADVNQMMDFCEEMLRATIFKVLGHTHVRFGALDIDFSQPFQRLTMRESVARFHPRTKLRTRTCSSFLNITLREIWSSQLLLRISQRPSHRFPKPRQKTLPWRNALNCISRGWSAPTGFRN